MDNIHLRSVFEWVQNGVSYCLCNECDIRGVAVKDSPLALIRKDKLGEATVVKNRGVVVCTVYWTDTKNILWYITTDSIPNMYRRAEDYLNGMNKGRAEVMKEMQRYLAEEFRGDI